MYYFEFKFELILKEVLNNNDKNVFNLYATNVVILINLYVWLPEMQ